MSSVHAVTEDITFTAKVASFRELKTDILVEEFGKWLVEKGKEQHFIVWSTTIEGKIRDKK
jgi:hypothetical protein